MKRTRTNRNEQGRLPDLIFSADLHLRETPPINRTDDFNQAILRKLSFLKSFEVPVLDAGDLFNHWKPSPWLLSFAIENLPRKFCTIPGNHDLPNHNIELFHKSGLYLLSIIDGTLFIPEIDYKSFIANKAIVHGIPYGGVPNPDNFEDKVKDKVHILLFHVMVWKESPPFPDAVGYSSKQLLKMFYKKFDIIITGHNHRGFTDKYRGSILVNPGAMHRSSVDEVEYKPRVYGYSFENHKVWPIYYPIEKDVFLLDKIEDNKRQESRIKAYLENLSNGWDKTLSFTDNLEAFFKKNKVKKSIEEMIWQSLEEN